MAPHVFMAIEQAALRAVKEGIYQHHPGAPDDGCDSDFKECIAFEFIVSQRALLENHHALRLLAVKLTVIGR